MVLAAQPAITRYEETQRRFLFYIYPKIPNLNGFSNRSAFPSFTLRMLFIPMILLFSVYHSHQSTRHHHQTTRDTQHLPSNQTIPYPSQAILFPQHSLYSPTLPYPHSIPIPRQSTTNPPSQPHLSISPPAPPAAWGRTPPTPPPHSSQPSHSPTSQTASDTSPSRH